jgi:hypothetical protein
MHPAIAIWPIVALFLGFGFGAALSTFISRPKACRVIRWVAIILCVGSWLAYISGVLNWRYNVEPFQDGTEGVGVGFGAIFVHVVVLLPTLFLTGLSIAILWIQTRRCSIQRRLEQEAQQAAP